MAELIEIANGTVELIGGVETPADLGVAIGADPFVKVVGEGYLTLWQDFGEPVHRVGCWTSRWLARRCLPPRANGPISETTMISHFETLFGLVGGHLDPTSRISQLVVDWLVEDPWHGTPNRELLQWCERRSDQEFTALTVGCSILVSRAARTGLVA
jgi:hypothetical protein